MAPVNGTRSSLIQSPCAVMYPSPTMRPSQLVTTTGASPSKNQYPRASPRTMMGLPTVSPGSGAVTLINAASVVVVPTVSVVVEIGSVAVDSTADCSNGSVVSFSTCASTIIATTPTISTI